MEKKVKFGIVGVGSRGLQAFSTMICKRSDAEIAAKLDAKRIADAEVVLQKDAGVMERL